MIRKKVKPVARVPLAEIEKLIGRLDNADGKERDRASAELRAIGPQSKAALEKSLAGCESVERRLRILELLTDFQRRERTPTQGELRELRALEILEVVGTPSARAVLGTLAKGAPGARLTVEASAALDRLGERMK
jgi:hypothetical protein